MNKKNIMVFAPARGGTTLLSLILGAHSDITNFGESHWIFKSFYKDLKKGKIDNSCRAHGSKCSIINNIKKKISYENHFKILSLSSDTKFILTTNKNYSHYKKMDYKNFKNKVILMYKPLEMWVGSFLGTNKIKLPSNKDLAIKKLSDIHCSYYLKNLDLIKKDPHLKDYMVVNYQDLVYKKDTYVKEICLFLGIDFEENMMKFNSHLLSKDKDQHPIGGNIKTYYNLNKGKDDRYVEDIDSIYIEAKYKNLLTVDQISAIKKDKTYVKVKRELGLGK